MLRFQRFPVPSAYLWLAFAGLFMNSLCGIGFAFQEAPQFAARPFPGEPPAPISDVLDPSITAATNQIASTETISATGQGDKTNADAAQTNPANAEVGQADPSPAVQLPAAEATDAPEQSGGDDSAEMTAEASQENIPEMGDAAQPNDGERAPAGADSDSPITKLIANQSKRPDSFDKAKLIHLSGPINGLRAAFIRREVDRAKSAGVDLLVVEITSPGGELETSLELARLFEEINWAHTVAYVPTEAISGGAIIALGCDEIIMRPRAEIGDAGPVALGMDLQFRHAPEKIVSYLAQNLRDLAVAQGRPAAIAEAMADRNLEVVEVRDPLSQKTWYLTRDELESSNQKGRWEEIGPVFEARKDHFLTVAGDRSVELLISSKTLQDKAELWSDFNITPPVVEAKETWLDTTAYILSRPFITAILILVGLAALYIELTMPGIGAGGAIAFACFGLFFWSRFLGGSAGWLDVSLFVIGIGLLAMEFFVIPGFGIAGLGGLSLIVVSLFMAMQRFSGTSDTVEWSQMGTSLLTILGAFSGFIVIVAILANYSESLPLFRNLKLKPPTAEPYQAALLNRDPNQGDPNVIPLAVGDVGVCLSTLRPSGKAMFGDRIVDVISEGDFVDGDTQIKILRINGNQIIVRALA